MSVLKGQGNSGDFVLKGQQTATSQGHSHVSQIWYDKTMSYDDAINKMEIAGVGRKDYLVPMKEITFALNRDGDFCVRFGSMSFLPTEHALKQIATRVDISQKYVCSLWEPKKKANGAIKYNRDYLDGDALVHALDNGKRRVDPDKNFKLRTYDDGTLRAMLTEEYDYINNLWYMEQLKELLPGGRVSHWDDRGNADTFYGNILIPDTIRKGYDGDYGAMISGSNCEIGRRVFSQTPSLFRAICMNGCIWDRTGGHALRMRHRWIDDLSQVRIAIMENINEQIPLADEYVERFLKLREKSVNKVPLLNIFANVGKTNKLSAKQTVNIAEAWSTHERDNENLFGIVNAITRAGQKESPDTWVKFDEIGGDMFSFSDNKWDAFLNRSLSLTVDEINHQIGVAV